MLTRHYKGYVGNIEFDSNHYHGHVLGIRDEITYEGASPVEAERKFRNSVDDYLAYCEEHDRQPTIC